MSNLKNEENTLETSYVKTCKGLAEFRQCVLKIQQERRNMSKANEENEDIKALEAACLKCRNGRKDVDEEVEETAHNFPHIQDLCPADRKRISLLVKHLAKCTQEMHKAQSDLVVSESEKEALLEEYKVFVCSRDREKRCLESKLLEAQTQMSDLKSRVTRALHLLSVQVAVQEKQLVKLVENMKDFLHEKVTLHESLIRKDIENNDLKAKIRRLEESLQMEKLLHSKDLAKCLVAGKSTEMIDSESQTTDQLHRNNEDGDYKQKVPLAKSRSMQTKCKEDLDELTTDGTLMRDLFFRIPNVDDNEPLHLMPTFLPKSFSSFTLK